METIATRMRFLLIIVVYHQYAAYYGSVPTLEGCEAFARVPVLPSTTSSMREEWTVSSTTTSTTTTEFSGGFDGDQMEALIDRGKWEAKIMGATGELEELQKKKKKKQQKQNKKNDKPSTALLARALSQEGVLRMNGVLSTETATRLREDILRRRQEAYVAIGLAADADTDTADDGNIDTNPRGTGHHGTTTTKENWRQYFADVLLKRNRCDLLLPLKGNLPLQVALKELLIESPRLRNLLPPEATLYELSSLISEKNSPRQPIHPDNPYQAQPPLYTLFIALQDITPHMGGTIFLPKTNTATAHRHYNDIPQRDAFLTASPNVRAVLQAGDATLFDSRTLHCGGANDPVEGATRVILYLSFRNPRATEAIGNVGSLLPDIPPLTIRELCGKLLANTHNGNGNNDDDDPFDEEDRRRPKPEEAAVQRAATNGDARAQLQVGIGYYVGSTSVAVDPVQAVYWFTRAADQGLAHAQFNLGCCYSLTIGVPQQDLARAIELFHSAAEQDHPGAHAAWDEAVAEHQKKKGDRHDMKRSELRNNRP